MLLFGIDITSLTAKPVSVSLTLSISAVKVPDTLFIMIINTQLLDVLTS